MGCWWFEGEDYANPDTGEKFSSNFLVEKREVREVRAMDTEGGS
jgi:hypothetical protein